MTTATLQVPHDVINPMVDAAANPDVLKYRISIAYDEKAR